MFFAVLVLWFSASCSVLVGCFGRRTEGWEAELEALAELLATEVPDAERCPEGLGMAIWVCFVLPVPWVCII